MQQPGGGSLDPQGPVAETMADLWWLMLGLGTAVFLLVVVLLVLGLFRRRPQGEPEPGNETSTSSRRWLVGGGVVLPAIVLTVTLGATVVAMRDLPDEAPPDALVVEIVGHQWWWEVHYPEEDITTANELHIPVGRPIALQLSSADVVHSFWVPRLAGKIDLLPDGTNELILQADEPGEHRSDCAEFCGLQHTRMTMNVVAEPADDFESWIAEQQQPAAEPAEATAQEGHELFVGGECATCHSIQGTTADGTSGPDLTHFAGRATIGAGAAPNSPADLAEWVADPHTIKEGVKMPAAEVTDEQLEALLAYLETLE